MRSGMDVRFKVPSNFYISGQSQCGKSYLVRRLLYYLNELFHPVPSKVIYCYGEYQKEFDELHGVDFIEGFPEDLNELTQGHEQTLLILDDLMSECSKDQRVSDLFTRGSHHKGISVFYLTQNLFPPGKLSRTISLNSHYFIVFKNPRDSLGIATLAKQMFPIPCQADYGANFMKPEAREAFLAWHKEQVESDYLFDFQKEIIKYCRSDVDILRKCCMLFREMLRDETGIDPFERSLTIASYCHEVYRTNFLKKDTIAVFQHDRQLKMKQSNMAVKWLSYEMEKEDIHIQHVRNGGEKRVGRYSLDGYCEEYHTAYEFQGCFWHGKDCNVMNTLLILKKY